MLSLLKDNKFVYKQYEECEILGINQVVTSTQAGIIYKFTENKFVKDDTLTTYVSTTSASETSYIIEPLNYPTVIQFLANNIKMKYRCPELLIYGTGGPMYGYSTLPIIVPKNLTASVSIFNVDNENNIDVYIRRYTI